MLRTLDRYILREITLTWAAVTGVLLFILISNQFARILGDAAAGKLPREAVLALLGLTSLNYLTILVPIALFLSVMLALGRLYQDSEMAAINACGVGPRRLFRPVMLVALVLAGLMAWMSFGLSPWAANQIHVLRETAKQDAEIGSLEAGRFRPAVGGDAVFYAESVDADGVLSNLFVQNRRGDTVEVALAARGEQRTDTARGLRSMILFDGRRYEGIPGTVGFRVIEFVEHGIPIRLSPPDLTSDKTELLPSSMLIGSSEPGHIAEFHWRLSVPLAAAVLAFLAVPLSRTTPRQGRYGKLAVAVMVYILYSNLLGAGRVWVEQLEVPPWLGLWWVHGLVLMAAIALLVSQNGLAVLSPASPGGRGARRRRLAGDVP